MGNKKILLCIIISFLLAGCPFLDSSGNPFKDEKSVENAEEKAKAINKNKFINYKVNEKDNDSKELIAVVFNTDDETNLGFIDEYGNVIKEPFLKQDYDYYETLRGSIGIDDFVGEYFRYLYLDENDDYYYVYYDRNFNEVALSCSEQKEYENNIDMSIDNGLDEKKIKILKSHLDDILKKGYERFEHNIGFNGEIYDIMFVYNIGYHILLDSNFNLLTPLYFPDRPNLNLFASPDKGSIVGNFFVKDLGLVYYNTYGDIIWITYCK